MAADNDAQRLIDDSRTLMNDSKQVFDDVQQLYDNMRNKASIGEYYQENPYAVLAAAAGVGYVLGGGLFSPFTKRILKVAMKGMLIPLASSQIKNLTANVHPSEGPYESGQ
ncbi:hypothetical protein FIV42_21155 [Persicimonas caeni]|uniref:Uncharacterized protein n=1 Tax=Persicimonas caeni TaxID=2292766 RepID=A0A4Y6PY56_PERCE|nr:hypothetical protein [Persicimonas caeni]QDG53160.1 hypothetical protein FIV42_21155 [Persicimonas caeni]QED34382.1 hypothetical protein FRD00_21150 [Persicimonas caeni]